MSTSPVPPIPPQVGSRLRIAWERIQEHISRRLAEQGFDDLRPVHRPFQQWPPMDGLRPTDVAARHGMSKQATNDLLRDLQRFGYITLERDPDDGRARRVRNTQRGWDLLRLGGEVSKEVGEGWAKVVGARDYAIFHHTLQRIVDHELGLDRTTTEQPPR